MPFEGDAADFAPMKTPVLETEAQRVIRQARELLEDPEHWTRDFQIDDSFCILGALRHVHHGNAWRPGTGGAQDHVTRVLRRRGYAGITTFNDRYATHEDILTTLDLAYEAAGKPKGAKLDAKALPRKPLAMRCPPAPFGRDLLSHDPLPPPVRLCERQPLSAEAWAARISACAGVAPKPARVMSPMEERARAMMSAFEAHMLPALSLAFGRI